MRAYVRCAIAARCTVPGRRSVKKQAHWAKVRIDHNQSRGTASWTQTKKDAYSVLEGLRNYGLRGNGVRQGSRTLRRAQNAATIAGRDDIGSASIESGGPHLFVCQAMRANNAGAGKLPRKTFDILDRGQLHVQNYDMST